jgi:galactose mutarotase-like enzyme
MAEPALLTIRNNELSATVSAKGAELQSLVPPGGDNVIWSADPAFWAWHAPNLFPIVGALVDDTLIHEGRRYAMKQHGFLRHSLCAVIEESEESCAFKLIDNYHTRAQYPFAFALTIAFRLNGDRLDCVFTLANPASTPLYASLGAHPAFRWPLRSAERSAHSVRFAHREPEPIRRLDHGLLTPDPAPTPVKGNVLNLKDELFAGDALIFDKPQSRVLTYGAAGGPAIELGFPDFPYLGIWSKPGAAPFLCLEPWQGLASPVDFRGEFSEKPGVVALAPGEERSWRYWICPKMAAV